MKRHIVQMVTLSIAIGCSWGMLSVIYSHISTKPSWEDALLSIIGAIATLLFILYTFIFKEA